MLTRFSKLQIAWLRSDALASGLASLARRRTFCVVCALLGALLIVLGAAGPAAASAVGPVQDYDVLFIGNSYTAQTWESFEAFVDADAGTSATIGVATRGGWTLLDHYDNRAVPSYDGNTVSLIDALQARDWDLVVLQEQSTRPSAAVLDLGGERAGFRAGMIGLSGLIAAEAPTAELVYFETWPRDFGDPYVVANFANKPKKMHAATELAYARAAGALGGQVVPMGSAFTYMLYFRPAIPVHQGDGSHPNAAGQYLTGALFWAMLYDRNPLGGTYDGGLDAATAGELRQTAYFIWQTYRN